MSRPGRGSKALFVNHTAELGGGELSLLDLVSDRPAPTSVVLFQDGPFRLRLQEAGVDVEVLQAFRSVLNARRDIARRPGLGTVAGVAVLAMRIARRARHFDVVHVNSQKALVAAGPAGWLARRPVIWHLRDLLTPDHFGASQRRLAIALSRRFAARVIANSRATRNAFIDAGGHEDLVAVVYNGIDPAPFDAVSDEDGLRVRSELGVGDAPLIGLFGRLAPWKGQTVLVEALTRLPGVHALIVGEALFDADRGMPAALRNLTGALGVGDRTHLLGFRSDVPALMRACDVIVHASGSPEPFGRVIVEGMLSNRPVVATASGGALEVVDDGRTGLLTPPGDAGALAAAVNRLLEDRDMARALASAAGVEARSRFSLEGVRAGVEAVIDGVVRARQSGA